MPLSYLRVKDKDTGAHYTELAAVVQSNPDAYQLLDEPAVNPNGDPLPALVPTPTSDPETGEPPRTGRGSGVEVWTEYATALGLEIPEDSTRDQVVELVDTHKENI